jgi:GT2 family glycosyltransferase
MCSPKVSIVICSFNRHGSLRRLKKSISLQSFQDYEQIIIDYEAPLVTCKNDGILKSNGEYILFLDDDVELTEDYLLNAVTVLDSFPEIGGISGYTIEQGTNNRDSLKFNWFQPIYRYFFMGGNVRTPNKRYFTEVDFLEPSNYIVRKKYLRLTGGFGAFEGVAEWSDVDFFYRLRGLTKFFNCPQLFSIHHPTKDQTYKKRFKEIWHRYRNFKFFAERQLKPSFKLWVYERILILYFFLNRRTYVG